MKILYCLFIAFILVSCVKKEDHIRQWRGVNRDGIYQGKGITGNWSGSGPEICWYSDSIGNGYGSPVIKDEVLFVNGEIDSMAYTFAFSTKGEMIWKTSFGNEWTRNFPGSRSTPTYYKGLLYVSSGKGDIACINAKSGEILWSLNMLEDLNGRMNRFGYSQSLLVDKKKVYCAPGGKDTNIVALDRFKGELIWVSPAKGEISAYCSPLMINLYNLDIVVTFSEHHMVGIDAMNGDTLWSHKQETKGFVHSNTPAIKGSYIYYISGAGNKSVKLELSEDGKQIKEVWRNKKLDNALGGFVINNNVIIASGHGKKCWMCLDIQNGEVTDSIEFGRGSTIMADSIIFAYNDKGKVGSFIECNGKLTLLDTFNIEKGTRAHF